MPYVIRNNKGEVVALSKTRDHADAEYLSIKHPDVLGFIDAACDAEHAQDALIESDAELARVTEDLIQVLIEKKLLLITELPLPVQAKLSARQKLRQKLSGIQNLSPLSDDETI